jgi:hypothetical protein
MWLLANHPGATEASFDEMRKFIIMTDTMSRHRVLLQNILRAPDMSWWLPAIALYNKRLCAHAAWAVCLAGLCCAACTAAMLQQKSLEMS